MWQHSEFHKSRLGLGLRLLDASREGVQDFERLLKNETHWAQDDKIWGRG